TTDKVTEWTGSEALGIIAGMGTSSLSYGGLSAVDYKVNISGLHGTGGNTRIGNVTGSGKSGSGSIGEGIESGSNSYSGEEWCRYFRETYGNNNVTWENATPSQLARSWQGSGKYIGIDEYTDVTVNKGTILYRGEPNGTEYFTTLDAIEQSGRNATTIFEGLQVEKNPIHGYRGEMQGYLFNEDVASAYGITNANPQFGNGGLPQYYVPDVQDLISKGILTPVDNIKLYK
ncbi:MAG: hypothetical protein SO445_05335, partial [Lachnospiraceae bacterium]|nr:hypothetical protein [Lachnospiraceae bacterium]MDY4617117.1 hypothetical protein [Lachnospiraceae bacterium]